MYFQNGAGLEVGRRLKGGGLRPVLGGFGRGYCRRGTGARVEKSKLSSSSPSLKGSDSPNGEVRSSSLPAGVGEPLWLELRPVSSCIGVLGVPTDVCSGLVRLGALEPWPEVSGCTLSAGRGGGVTEL